MQLPFEPVQSQGLLDDLDAARPRPRPRPIVTPSRRAWSRVRWASTAASTPPDRPCTSGNLQQLVLLRRFQDAGHRPIALAGGATGLIGDPGRQDRGASAPRSRAGGGQRGGHLGADGRLLDFEPGPNQARLVNNLDWTGQMGAIEFLRDVGKYMTVNTMLAKDSVRTRIERESGISFTEFCYMLLQANDFQVLYEREGCELQVAGSDQWGNITAGIELIRRRIGGTAHGLTSPLLLRADGTKFGKSESGAVWLDPGLTSPYQFFQFFMQVADDEVGTLLRRFTLVPVAEIDEWWPTTSGSPSGAGASGGSPRRSPPSCTAPRSCRPIEAATDVLFGGDPTAASPEALRAPGSRGAHRGARLGRARRRNRPVDLFVRAGLAKSKGEVRRNLAGHYVNGSLDRGRRADRHERSAARGGSCCCAGGRHHHDAGNRHNRVDTPERPPVVSPFAPATGSQGEMAGTNAVSTASSAGVKITPRVVVRSLTTEERTHNCECGRPMWWQFSTSVDPSIQFQ